MSEVLLLYHYPFLMSKSQNSYGPEHDDRLDDATCRPSSCSSNTVCVCVDVVWRCVCVDWNTKTWNPTPHPNHSSPPMPCHMTDRINKTNKECKE